MAKIVKYPDRRKCKNCGKDCELQNRDTFSNHSTWRDMCAACHDVRRDQVALAILREKANYGNKECNNRLDSVALNISESFKNSKQNKKKYELTADASRTYPFTGKSTVTSLSFNFTNEGEIILSCYNMDKEANKNSNFMMSTLNQKDS